MTQPFNFYGSSAPEESTVEYEEEDLIGYSSASSFLSATQPFEAVKAPEKPPVPATTVGKVSLYGATQPFSIEPPDNELGDIFDNEGPASPEAENEEEPAAPLYQTQQFGMSQPPAEPIHPLSGGYEATQRFAEESPASPKANESGQPESVSQYQTQVFNAEADPSQASVGNRQSPPMGTQQFGDADETDLLGDTADIDDSSPQPAPVDIGDDSDDEGVGEKKKSRAAVLVDSDHDSEAGEIIRDIFGSDEEGDGEFEGFDEKEHGGSVSDSALAEDLNQSGNLPRQEYESDEDTDVRSNLPQGFEYDFDVMMRKRKAENSRARRKKKDGDVINDSDDLIQFLCEQMKEAAREDRELNGQKQPAMRKRKLLPQVLQQLKKQDLQSAFIDGGIITSMTEWISPLPDKSLPALEIRNEFLKLLIQFPALPSDILKSSNIGKAVMYLYKNPKETRANKALAAKLISEWARPIFNIQTDFRSLTKEERVQRDLEHMPQAKKRRTTSVEEIAVPKDETRPGEKGFVPRARVPQPSTRDYIVRPKWNIGEGENVEKISSNKKTNRLDRKMREFKERTKQTKSFKAVAVSVSGNKM